MSEIQLSAFVGVLLSLVFSYIPGLNKWYEGLATDLKRAIMGGLLIVTSAAIFGLSCAGLGPDLGVTVACSKAGGIELLNVIIAALVANQSAFLVTRG